MLQNTKELYGHKLSAIDGKIGHVKDFYFDDKIWVIRYLVADTGSWLTGRLVLLSPHAFGNWDQFDKTLYLKLPRKKIEDCPSINLHKPVSRQYENEYHRYYGWPAYWNPGAIFGGGGSLLILPESKDEMDADLNHSRFDKNLQSSQEVMGYQIQAGNEMIGHLSGFLVDDRSWAIHKLVVETGHWYSGKELLISPQVVDRISCNDSKIFVNLTITEIQNAAPEKSFRKDAANHLKDTVTAQTFTLSRMARKLTNTLLALPIPISGNLAHDETILF